MEPTWKTKQNSWFGFRASSLTAVPKVSELSGHVQRLKAICKVMMSVLNPHMFLDWGRMWKHGSLLICPKR